MLKRNISPLSFLLIMLLLGSCTSDENTNTKATFTQQDILHNLESPDLEDYHFFINLEHPYFFTASSRLTLFADKKRWAIVFEKSGYANRGFRGEIELSYFGNCLRNLKDGEDNSTSNMKTIVLIDNKEMERIEAGNFELVGKNINTIKVRDSLFSITNDRRFYTQQGIHDTVYDHDNEEHLVDIPTLIRYLSEQHPAAFRATNEELRTCLPIDLPKLMTIDNWHHESFDVLPAYALNGIRNGYEIYGKKPSDYETYRMIANVLATRDTTKWKPTLKPNNNWRNWPRAGYM